MAEPGDGRVAVYIDFDNIIISRYDQVNGRNAFQRDRARVTGTAKTDDPEILERLERATVDIGAVIDFASSFGTLVLTRAYADWSTAMNADYRGQLVGRAVDLVQLFPAAAYAKNGADIRLAVDAVEDLFRLPDLTHIVLVAGDSDYIALAQRCKRLGRYVVGIGMAGSTSKTLAAACDEFVNYDDLPGIVPAQRDAGRAQATKTPAAQKKGSGPSGAATAAPATDSGAGTPTASEPPSATTASAPRRRASRAADTILPPGPVEFVEPDLDGDSDGPREDPQEVATRLLERALRLGHEKDDAEWLHSSSVKNQMKRMDPSFSEKTLGFRSFSDFVKSREQVAELDDSTTVRLVRLAPALASERD